MKELLFIMAIAMLLGSCATVHCPSHVNTSMITDEGETQVGGSINFSSVTAHATHAFSENFRLASSFNSWGWSFTLGSSTTDASGIQGQILPGY